MKHTFTFDSDKTVIRLSGTATLQGFRSFFVDLLKQPQWKTGSHILIDYCSLNVDTLAVPEIRTISKIVAGFREGLGKGKCALVTDKALGFGLGRMLEMVSEQEVSMVMKAFQSLTEAHAWLQGPGAADEYSDQNSAGNAS